MISESISHGRHPREGRKLRLGVLWIVLGYVGKGRMQENGTGLEQGGWWIYLV
jgi:hypothetical protein